MSFAKDVRSLSITMEEMGNPLLENTLDLLVLDSRNIVDSSVKDRIVHIENMGQNQYNR